MIPDHFTIQYGQNFTSAIQQSTSRLKKAAIVETGCTGEAVTHNLDLPIEDNESTGERISKTVLTEIDTAKRWNRPRKFDLATPDVPFDETLLAPTILPGGKHIQLHRAAYERRLDKVFVEGAFGTNYVGKEGVTASQIPDANIIEVDFVSSGSPADSSLVIDKIIRAKTILRENESFGDDAIARGIQLWGAMTPGMEESLLFLANASNGSSANRLFSRDFMPPTLDANGNISSFLGINWIRTSHLPYDVDDATIRFAGVWTSDAVHLDVWQDIMTSVATRSDLKDITQFFSQYAFNACRSQDEKVVKLACKVSA
jgi:hypothetical protein